MDTKLLRALDNVGTYDKNQYPIPLVDISNLTEEDWLKWRALGIGGSDTAAILNVSPWKTKLQFFHEKTGKAPAFKKNYNAAAKMAGHVWEPYVAQVLEYKLKQLDWVKTVEILDDTTMYRCGQKNADGSLKWPFAQADFDRVAIINGVPYIAELKTTNLRNYSTIKKWSDGIVPFYYETQVRHYMAVANIDHAVICCCWGVNFQDTDSAMIFIDRDMSIEEELMQAEADFVECCECGFAPDVDDEKPVLLQKYYNDLYGLADKELPAVELTEAYADAIQEIIKAQERVERAEKELSKMKELLSEAYNKVIPALVAPDGTRISGCAYYNDKDTDEHISLTVKQSRKRAAINEEKFKLDHPEAYEKCLETKFSMSKLSAYDKKEKTHFKKDYLLPEELTDNSTIELNVKITPLSN